MIWLIITVVGGAVPFAFAVTKFFKDLGALAKDASETVKNIAETRDLNAGVGQKRADEAKLWREAELINEELDVKRLEKLQSARAFAADEVNRIVSRSGNLDESSLMQMRIRSVETIKALFSEPWLQSEAISEFEYLLISSTLPANLRMSSLQFHDQDNLKTVEQQFETLEERLRKQPSVQINGEASPQQNGIGQSSS